MKKKNKYGRNAKLNPNTHCVMGSFNDTKWIVDHEFSTLAISEINPIKFLVA